MKITLRSPRCYVSPKPKSMYASSNTLQELEKFKYTVMVFARDGSQNNGIDVRIGRAKAVLQYCSNFIALWSQSGAFKYPEVSVFKSVFAPVLTCGHESWIITQIGQSHVQAAEMGILWRVLGMTLRDKRSLLRIERFQPVVVLVSAQDVQMGAPMFNLRALRGPPFLVHALSKIWDFVYDCIFIIMITQ